MKIISFPVLVIPDFLCSFSLFSQQSQNINLALLDGIKDTTTITMIFQTLPVLVLHLSCKNTD